MFRWNRMFRKIFASSPARKTTLPTQLLAPPRVCPSKLRVNQNLQTTIYESRPLGMWVLFRKRPLIFPFPDEYANLCGESVRILTGRVPGGDWAVERRAKPRTLSLA